jgi:glycine/D-amino acid oxidase-like deaminating enzyme
MNRRSFLQTSSAFAALSLPGCKQTRTAAPATAPTLPWYDPIGPIAPIHADASRLFNITCCTRPFRAAGPRIEAEKIGDKIVIHNYGHGGSGWSLSWGSAQVAVTKAQEALSGKNNLAVIGCGAIGLTSAITAQRAGQRVTIYAKERPPFVRSSRATGTWTPDSRVALTSAVAPSFGDLWETMARRSLAIHQSYLGTPGTPVEWQDAYQLSDLEGPQQPEPPESGTHHIFAAFHDRIHDDLPRWTNIDPALTPFPTASVNRGTQLIFNIADYSRQLLNEFLTAGGQIETREFHSPQDLAALSQPVIVNCTGYAARQLFSDESIVPIRGQIGWLVPQPEVRYNLYYQDLILVSRRDGIAVQTNPQGDDTGWNDAIEQPDRATTEDALRRLQALYSRMKH